jgi:SHS2 domain-containing protein
MVRYKLLDHTADIGIIAYGKTLSELFENAALGMFEIITSLEKVKILQEEEIKVESESIEELLVEWLRELLWRFNTGGLYKEFVVSKLTPHFLQGWIKGEKFNPSQHFIQTEIKTVTYHNLEIKKEKGLWQASIIFDI